jgi:hypothetical protein
MAANKHFRAFRPGDVLTAAHQNAVAREVERLGRISVGPGLELRDNPGGLYIGLSGEDTVRLAKSGAGGVPAFSGSTPGSATVRLWRFGTTFVDGTVDVTAYNFSTTAIAATKNLVLIKVDGKWVVIFESC